MDQDRAADFVKRFTGFWQAPTLERLDSTCATPTSLHRWSQPPGKRTFAHLFELIPDITANVHRWGATFDGVLIEFTVRTASKSPIS